MRHIITMISKTDLQPLPKLMVFDFLKGNHSAIFIIYYSSIFPQ